MTTEEKEEAFKKRLKNFLGDLLRVGTVKGFKNFAMYLRGREELVISVVNEPLDPDNTYCESSGDSVSPLACSYASAASIMSMSLSCSFNSGNLPYDKRSLMLSARTQRSLSGYGDIGVGLPPASPSDHEIENEDENSTLFLLAGYARYNCPYVWVRSNHQRLVKFIGESDEDRDNPLRLKSTRKWKDSDVKVWDVIAELVKLCTYPPPTNPFAVDFEYFDNLPMQERLLATAAMVNFLQKVFLSKKEDRTYTAKVMEDLQAVTKLHFKTLQALAVSGELPVLQEQRQQEQQPQSGPQQPHSSSLNYTHYRTGQSQYSYRYTTGIM